MLRNIFPKIFLIFLLCSMVFFSIPSTTFSAPCTEEETKRGGYNQGGLSDGGPITEYTCVIPPTGSSGGVGAWILSTITGLLTGLASWILTNLILIPINWFLEMVVTILSKAFDYTVYFTIVKFKTNFGDLKLDIFGSGIGGTVFGASGSSLIYYLWGIIRDFLNIILFITIIYHAVQSMFEGFNNTRRKFISLLVFSIVVNFSLFFVKISIDVSNILALQAYTLAVKPIGTDSFANFSKSNSYPNSYGEYIMEKVSYGKLKTAVTGSSTPGVTVTETSDLKNTFFFQLGKMIVLAGLIYIFLFMIGFLLMRAVVLLYAMIISPFLAADLFFKNFKTSDEIQQFATQIRSITNAVRGDFYDALVKGPLLIFFVFLIGVFASAIFNTSIATEIGASSSTVAGLSDLPDSLKNSLFVFFKFALFMTLCTFTFRKLKEINIFGEDGRRLTSFLKRSSNYLFGKGLGMGVGGTAGTLGWVGRNFISRPLSNSRIGKTSLDYVNNQALRLQQSTGFMSPISNRLGRLGAAGVRGLRGGSFDLRNATVNADGKTNLLGRAINYGAGVVGAKDIDVGTGAKGGYDTYDDARTAAQKARIDRDAKIAADSVVETADMRKKAKDETDIKLGSFTGKISELEELLKSKDFNDSISGSAKDFSVTLKSGKNVNITAADFDKFKDLADNKGDYYQQKTNTENSAVDKKVKDEKNRVKKLIEAQAADNKRLGSIKIIEKARDRISGRDTAGPEGSVAREYQKAAYTTSQEKERTSGIKKSVVYQLEKDIATAISTLNNAKSINPTSEIDKQISELTAFKDEVTKNRDNMGYFDGNSNLIERIIRTKETAAESVKNTFNSSRKIKEDEERNLQTQIADAKRGANRVEYDSWINELSAMNKASMQERKTAEFMSRKRKLQADIASASKNRVARSEDDIKKLEDALRETQKELKDVNAQYNSAKEIEQNSERTRKNFERNFAVKVEKAADTAKPADTKKA